MTPTDKKALLLISRLNIIQKSRGLFYIVTTLIFYEYTHIFMVWGHVESLFVLPPRFRGFARLVAEEIFFRNIVFSALAIGRLIARTESFKNPSSFSKSDTWNKSYGRRPPKITVFFSVANFAPLYQNTTLKLKPSRI